VHPFVGKSPAVASFALLLASPTGTLFMAALRLPRIARSIPAGRVERVSGDAPRYETQLGLLEKRRKEGAREAKWAGRYATSNSVAHYVFGGMGIAGGVAAAATASGSTKWIPVVAGALAALGSGLSTFFGFEARSKAHEKNRLLFLPVAEYAANELARVHATEADATEVASALAAVQARLDEARNEMA
jgi:hypothetical protein